MTPRSWKITKTMNAVMALISHANTNEHSPAAVETKAAIRDWWVQQQKDRGDAK